MLSHQGGGASVSPPCSFMRTLLIIFVILSLPGCAAGVVTGLGIASIAVTEGTGKTTTDHVISRINDSDCKLGRYWRDEQVCQFPSNGGLADYQRILIERVK